MQESKFERIMRSIYETQDHEISCTECFDQVSDYVDLEVAGEDALKKMPLVKQHLDQCRVCREEYDTLLALVRQAPRDDSPS